MSMLLPSRSQKSKSLRDLGEWRRRILDGILRGILGLWMIGLIGGIYNVIGSYRTEKEIHENSLLLAAAVITVYVVLTSILTLVTFSKKLRYEIRAGLLLFVFYALGAIGMSLSSFSGDGRIFLFAFVIFSAILFELRFSLSALAVALLTMLAVGWAQLEGWIVVPAERQINSTDLGAWVSGSIVLFVLSIAALISITYLLQALNKSFHDSQESLARQERLSQILRTVSDINQLLVREQDSLKLLQEACQLLIAGRGYSFAWVGLLQPDNVTVRMVAHAGDAVDVDRFTTRLDQPEGSLTCIQTAILRREFFRVEPSQPSHSCQACPRGEAYPNRYTVALPFLREGRALGALVVEHNLPSDVFDEQEIQLLQEMANDLAFALEKLEVDRQSRLMVETTSNLLAAQDADKLWETALTAVRQLLRADRAAIYQYDRVADRLDCVYASGLSVEYITQLNLLFHQTPGARIITSPEPVSVSDVQSDLVVGPMREAMIREGFRSYAVFTVVGSPGYLGAFVAYRNHLAPFSESDMRAGQTLCHVLSLAMENIRLYIETRTKAAELGTLYAAAQDMAASLADPPALLESLARHMVEALKATSGGIVAVNQAEQTLKVLAEYWASDARPAERHSDLGRVYPVDDYPIIMSSMATGQVLTIHFDDEGLSDTEKQQFADYEVKSMLFIPIVAQGKLLGDAEIWESRCRREFTQAEIRLAQAMASHAGSIIANAGLFTALQASEARYRTLVEQASDGIFIADSQRRYIDVNPAGCRMLGYTRAEILQMKMEDLAHQDELQSRPFRLADLLAGKTVITERNLKRKDGTYLPVEISAKILADGSLQGIVRDITERKRAEKALAEREAYFRALIENSAEGVVILDAQGNMRYVAPAEENLTGYSAAEALGKSAFQYIHPDDIPHVTEAFSNAISSQGSIKTLQYRLQHKNGEWRYFEATGHNMLNDPHIGGIVVNYRDITERIRAENLIHEQADELALAYDNTLAGWARALELRDELTEGHTRRVTEFSVKLARALGVPEQEISHLRRGALLHDIGKMGIPDSILHKPGPLTGHEKQIMQLHPQYARDMLSLIPFLRPALDIPYCHHEHWDGTGYPRGLKGEEIPLAARIFSVADVWDALTSDRPYREAWSLKKARDHIQRQSGKYFDPAVVEKFLQMDLDNWPTNPDPA
ncbi:MAG: PAS domain S-box protein [Chloroflexota bacterium]